jgi:hypothetical protein
VSKTYKDKLRWQTYSHNSPTHWYYGVTTKRKLPREYFNVYERWYSRHTPGWYIRMFMTRPLRRYYTVELNKGNEIYYAQKKPHIYYY